MAKQRYTVQQVIEACKDSAGIKAIVAKKLGCDRATICRYAKRYKTVRDALEQADEAATDMAEAAALKRIQAEYWPAIKYRLSTKGKDRGYTERQEITGAEGGEVVLKVVREDRAQGKAQDTSQ